MMPQDKTWLYVAIGTFFVGFVLLFISDKRRNSNGEWSNALQWGYLLMMISIFGILSLGLQWSFTAILLLFTAITGLIWAWRKKAWAGYRNNIPDPNHLRDYLSGFFPIVAVVFVLRTFIAEPFQIPSSSMRPNLVKGDFILVNKFEYGIRVPVLNNVLLPIKPIQRGDVVVFNYPLDPSVNYIKRIVAVGGDVVEYKNKTLSVNGNSEIDQEQGNYQYPDDKKIGLTHDAKRYQAQYANKVFSVLKQENVPSVEPATFMAYQQDMNDKRFISGLAENCTYAEDGSEFKCKVPAGKYFAMGDNRDSSADSRYWGFVDDKLIVGKAFFIWLNLNDMNRIGTIIQ